MPSFCRSCCYQFFFFWNICPHTSFLTMKKLSETVFCFFFVVLYIFQVFQCLFCGKCRYSYNKYQFFALLLCFIDDFKYLLFLSIRLLFERKKLLIKSFYALKHFLNKQNNYFWVWPDYIELMVQILDIAIQQWMLGCLDAQVLGCLDALMFR